MEAASLAAIYESGLRVDRVADVAAPWLSHLAGPLGCDYLALATYRRGTWELLAAAGQTVPLPLALLGDVLDQETPRAAGAWIAAVIEPRDPSPLLIALHGPSSTGNDRLARLAAHLPALRLVARHIGRNQARRRRLERLEALVALAARWQTHREMQGLLIDMAETATRLLQADRASIFLWDRATHTLVGRPALGIDEGELRVADNRGVVGRVMETGLPVRVDQADADQIDRRVDRQLGYRTRTLLCVPLRGRDGELQGVFEMINKLDGNFTDDDQELLVELAAHASIVLENTQERQELINTRQQLAEQAAQGVQLIGQHPAIAALRSTVARVARTDLAVLVLGENGTGKEVVSRAIHYLSSRRERPFVAVNCAALAESLLESELFGHEKGAFTDASQARPGKFELAAGGTLFLDEIGDLSPGGQAKLLRALEEKIVVRVGGSKPIHADARVIAATNQELAELVRQKRFREDLYFRLNVVALELPPLRARGEDVELLAAHFLAEFSRKARRKPPAFSPEALRQLRGHAWPGNVRELRNLIERLVYLLPGDTIEAADLNLLPPLTAPAAVDPHLPLAEATDQFQKEHIARAIRRAGGNMSEASQLLGLHRSNLYRKLRQLGLPSAS